MMMNAALHKWLSGNSPFARFRTHVSHLADGGGRIFKLKVDNDPACLYLRFIDICLLSFAYRAIGTAS